MNRFTQHPYTSEIKRRLFRTETRVEKLCGYLVAVAIGVGMAALLVAWWSS